ncbi:MAG: hypothetical protein JW940_00485 [Polyangiaceae bacterium]|nr:hypothetical protein [Polyangiaceae bacterium]
MTTFQDLLDLDDRLAAAGFPPLSPWWREQLRRYYEHPTATAFVARVGRGGAKSTTLCKVALCETLSGDWAVPPGELHFFGFVSASKDEASLRLRLLEAYLRALGIRFARSGDSIELLDMPRGFRVLACQIGSVSGFRCFGYALDELSKWESADHAANPANEVDASAAAMTVTHPGARRFKVSSPFGLDDHHYQLMARGDTEVQVTCEAPSWVANPSITEQQTRQLEPDEKTWTREYAAVPQSSVGSAFDGQFVEACFRTPPQAMRYHDVQVLLGAPVVVCDPSSGGSDEFSWATARLVRMMTSDGFGDFTVEVAVGVLLEASGGTQGYWGNETGGDVATKLARFAQEHGCRLVFGDQGERVLLQTELPKHGLSYYSMPWSNLNKGEAVRRARRLMSDKVLWLPQADDRMRRQLLGFQERLSPSGNITYSGKGHDDRVSLVLLAAHLEQTKQLPWVGRGERPLITVSGPRGQFNLRWPASYGGRGKEPAWDPMHESCFCPRAREAQAPKGRRFGGF